MNDIKHLPQKVRPPKYGVDVALTRADDLDRRLLATASKAPGTTVLDVGSGGGGQSLRLVQVGSRVTAVDVCDYRSTFERLRIDNDLPSQSLRFVMGSMTQLDSLLCGERFDYCSMQRAIHYIPYVDAHEMLTQLHTHVKDTLYISVTGIASAIGQSYQGTDVSIAARFCCLTPEDAQLFGITKPVCLYSKTEFEMLLGATGWHIEECWVSAFGNIKAVCKSSVEHRRTADSVKRE